MTQIPVMEMSFEDAMRELEQVVNDLERGDVALEDSIKLYERGAELKKHCQKKLDEARMKVDKIRVPQAGEPTTAEPFDT